MSQQKPAFDRDGLVYLLMACRNSKCPNFHEGLVVAYKFEQREPREDDPWGTSVT